MRVVRARVARNRSRLRARSDASVSERRARRGASTRGRAIPRCGGEDGARDAWTRDGVDARERAGAERGCGACARE